MGLSAPVSECDSVLADHAHILWLCPYVKPFWEEVGHSSSEILELRTDLHLGNIPKGLSRSDSKCLKNDFDPSTTEGEVG